MRIVASTPWQVGVAVGMVNCKKECKMAQKEIYEVNVELSIRKEGDVLRHIERVSLTDRVPEGEDPVQHLRKLISREFKRKFADLELPYDEDVPF